METRPLATFFSLPVELRLQIAAYALEQEDNVGILNHRRTVFNRDTCLEEHSRLDEDYNPSRNLSLLLVCGQFQHDFTNFAIQMTRFVFLHRTIPNFSKQLSVRLQHLRKLIIRCYTEWKPLAHWHSCPFDKASLRLEELCIVTDNRKYAPLPRILRYLGNIKSIKLVPEDGDFRLVYGRLVGAMYKEDHYHRYDATDAPDIGCTWWEPSLNFTTATIDFVAQEPAPFVAEEEFMAIMKPKIDELMEWTDRWSLEASDEQMRF